MGYPKFQWFIIMFPFLNTRPKPSTDHRHRLTQMPQRNLYKWKSYMFLGPQQVESKILPCDMGIVHGDFSRLYSQWWHQTMFTLEDQNRQASARQIMGTSSHFLFSPFASKVHPRWVWCWLRSVPIRSGSRNPDPRSPSAPAHGFVKLLDHLLDLAVTSSSSACMFIPIINSLLYLSWLLIYKLGVNRIMPGIIICHPGIFTV